MPEPEVRAALSDLDPAGEPPGRAKDRLDIELLLTAVDPLDLREIERWLAELGSERAQAGFAALIAASRR